MVADGRISDSELAQINAAAVTREYRVQPHIGMLGRLLCASARDPTLIIAQITALFLPSTGRRADL